MKRIVILGSTGSIGTNTLDIISKFTEKFQAVGLTANGNVDKLEEQVRTFSPAVVARSEEHTSELQSRLHLVCRLLLEKKKKQNYANQDTHNTAYGACGWS